MPPRHAKSLSVSVFWPTWEWLTHPESRWLFSSYALSLSVRDSLKCRRIIESHWYRQRYGHIFRLTGDQNAKLRFENDKTGYRIATSVDSAATGEGGDRVVVDDPINVRDADSEAIRQTALDWWDQAMTTRLNDQRTGAKVIVMQRVHEQDLSGHVLTQGGWEHLCLPAEYEPTTRVTGIGWADPRTEPGALLWPERVGPVEIASFKVALGSYGYAGQMQQRPAPAGGGIFRAEWWQTYPHTLGPQLQKVIQSWDTAFKDGDENDESACWTAGLGTDGRVYVLDVWHRRVTSAELIGSQQRPGIIAQHYAWFAQQGLAPAEVVIEDKGSGTTSVQMLALSNPYLPIVPVLPRGSKTERARAVTPFYEAGRILHPDGLPWVEEFQLQCERFPTGTHDDMVDAMTQGLPRLLLPPTELLEVPTMPRVRLS